MRIGSLVHFQFIERIDEKLQSQMGVVNPSGVIEIPRGGSGYLVSKPEKGMWTVRFEGSNIEVQTLPWAVKPYKSSYRKKRK